MGEMLRMVIFSQLPGKFWALYLSTKGEKAAEETVALPHIEESTMCQQRQAVLEDSALTNK